MKFLYKIYSRYDGFAPRRIPERMLPQKLLRLGWSRYIDVVEVGNEVWVYFHGPHKFENGVYVKGFVRAIKSDEQCVLLRVREYKTDQPLTDPETSKRVAEVVAPQFRQVFLLPEEWATPSHCTIGSVADSCKARKCDLCPAWRGLPLIEPHTHVWAKRLPRSLQGFAPAYWVIPSRCYLGRRIARPVRNTSEVFYRFKLGEEALAYPLALGMFEALRRRNLLDFETVVPIPLSPDKAAAGELHRTRLLAKELASLLGTQVAEVLALMTPISKRRFLLDGGILSDFDREYIAALDVKDEVKGFRRILVVDDVCTKGSTIRCTLRRIRDVHPACEVVAATAGQMILREVVQDGGKLLPA